MNAPLSEPFIGADLIGTTALVTTREWFIAPNGESYRAAFGTLRGVHSDMDTLGVRTNAHSTNWYLEIGCMLIAGCQIHYLVRSDTCSFDPPLFEGAHEGRVVVSTRPFSAIFNADGRPFMPNCDND